MKELICSNVAMKQYSNGESLTNQPQTPYSKGREIFMEGKPDMSPQPINPERSGEVPQSPKLGVEKPVSAERQEQARRLWEEADKGKAPTFEENYVRKEMIKRGLGPGIGGAEQPPTNEPPPTETGGEKPVEEKDQVTVFKKDLNSLGETIVEFPEIKQFLKEVSRSPIEGSRDLETMYGNFDNYSHLEFSKIVQDFVKREPPETDDERDSLVREFRGKMDELRKIRKKFIDLFEKNFVSQKRGISPDQQTLIRDIKNIEDSIRVLDGQTSSIQKRELQKELSKKVVELSRTVAPSDEPIPDKILLAIGEDSFATEEFLDRLIRLKQEDAPYRLPGMYSDINLNKFLKLNENTIESKAMDRLLNLVRATETLHEMNRILKTNVDQFAQISQTILSSHLTTVFNIPGVQAVHSLYDAIIKEKLSIETRITDDAFKEIDEQVEREFKAEADKKIKRDGREEDFLIQSLRGEGKLEDWEIERAVAHGRNLIRTLLTEAGYISFSTIPKDQAAFISLAQGQLLNIFHPVQYILRRFKPGGSFGGVEMLTEVLDRATKKRRNGCNKEESKGVVRLSVVMGTDVGDREATTIIGTRGAIATWRATEATLREFAILDNGSPSNITQFFEDHKKEISVLKEISKENAWESEWKNELKRIRGKYVDRKDYKTDEEWELAKNRQLEDWKRKRIRKVFGPLLDNNAVALGILVSPIPLVMPTEVKRMLWEKISELNPDVMASILTRLEIDSEAEGADKIRSVNSLEEILCKKFGTDKQKRLLFKVTVSDDLRGTLSQEELGDLTMAVLKAEEDIEKRIKGETDHDKLERLEKDLIELRGSLEWRPKLVKEELDKLTEDIEKLEVELQNGSESKKGRLREKLEEKGIAFSNKTKELGDLDNEIKRLLRGEEWIVLRSKLRTINRLRMIDEMKRINKIKTGGIGVESPKGFKEYWKDLRLLSEDRLTEKEQDVTSAISQNGKKIAQDIANIQQATVWFLEDVPTDIIKWENLGQFFNRMIGDFSQFGQAAKEINDFLIDPFKIPAAKAREHLSKAIMSAGIVLGPEIVQDNMKGIVKIYNEWIMKYPRYRQKFIDMAFSAMNKFTSKAQEVSRSSEALSLDEAGGYANLIAQNQENIIRREKRDENGKVKYTDIFEEEMKELGVGAFRRLFLANLRDWGPFALIAFLIEFFKEIGGPTAKR